MNDERFGALLEEIKTHPERHNQSSYIDGLPSMYDTYDMETDSHIPARTKEYEHQLINCGTTGCLAGLGSLRYAPVGTKFWRDVLILPNGERTDYANYGEEVLGLSYLEATYLFAGHREMDAIKDYYAMTKEQRAEFLDVFYND